MNLEDTFEILSKPRGWVQGHGRKLGNRGCPTNVPPNRKQETEEAAPKTPRKKGGSKEKGRLKAQLHQGSGGPKMKQH